MSKQLQVALILCTVMSQLKHDGQVYAADDQVELTEDQAAPLLANGTVQLAEAATDKAAAAVGDGQKDA